MTKYENKKASSFDEASLTKKVCCRGREIGTPDLLLPKQARYGEAALWQVAYL